MGSDAHYPEEAPAHPVHVDGFAIEAHQVTNAEYAEFVAPTGYRTVAERPLDPADYPGAPAENLQPGSMVFTGTPGPVDLRHLSQWWSWVAGCLLAASRRPGVVDRRAGRPPGGPRGARGRRRLRRVGRPRPAHRGGVGGGRPRWARRGAVHLGDRAGTVPASGWRTTGTGTSRGGPIPATARPRRSARFPRTATGSRHGRQRLGVDRRLLRTASRRRPEPCCAPRNPRGAGRGQLRPGTSRSSASRGGSSRAGRSCARTATAGATGQPPGVRRWWTPA